MEKEICKRETTRRVSTVFKYLAYGFVAFAALCLLVDLFVTTINDAWDIMFTDSSYTIPFFICVCSLVLAALLFVIEGRVSNIKISLVLTDKRIYSQSETSKFKQVENYNLKAITYYGFYQKITKGQKFVLVFKTSTDTVKHIVDKEFYDEFVGAVN
jgi:hypothetical protein